MKFVLNIFVILVGTIFNSKINGTFIASFQSTGEWSPNEYLEYTGSIPVLKEFTSCHWERTQAFSEKMNTIWAYCQHFSNDDWYLRCIEIYLNYPNPDGKVSMELYNNGWINDTMFFEIEFRNYRGFS